MNTPFISICENGLRATVYKVVSILRTYVIHIWIFLGQLSFVLYNSFQFWQIFTNLCRFSYTQKKNLRFIRWKKKSASIIYMYILGVFLVSRVSHPSRDIGPVHMLN